MGLMPGRGRRDEKPAESAVPGQVRLVHRLLVLWLASAVVLTLWSLATPHWTPPDDPAHQLRAWGAGNGQVVLEDPGQVEGLPFATLGVNQIPETLLAAASSVGCYAGQPEVSAECISDMGDGREPLLPYFNPLGQYLPAYYMATGWPSRFADISDAFTANRAAAVLLASLFLAWGLVAARSLPRPHIAATGVILACSPQVLYFGGVLNPNSLEIMAAIAMGACSLVYFRDPDGPTAKTMIRVALVAAAVLALTRMLSPLWLMCWAAFLLVVFGTDGVRALFRRGNLGWVALPALACLGSVGWTVTRLGPTVSGRSSFDLTFHEALTASMAQIDTTNLAEVVGVFGWKDTGLRPGLVHYYIAAAVFLIGACWMFVSRRASLALALWVAVCYLVPILLQAAQWNANGPVWQARYSLPLLVLLPISVACFASTSDVLGDPFRSRMRLLVPAVLALVGYVQVAAYATQLRRNVDGVDGGLTDGAWTPWPGSVVLLAAWTVVVVLVWAVLARAYWRDGAARTAIATGPRQDLTA